MSEKKGSWFSRLFKSGKKDEEVPQEKTVADDIAIDSAALAETVEPVIERSPKHHKETISEIEREEILESVAESVVENNVEQGEQITSMADEIEKVKAVEDNIVHIEEAQQPETVEVPKAEEPKVEPVKHEAHSAHKHTREHHPRNTDNSVEAMGNTIAVSSAALSQTVEPVIEARHHDHQQSVSEIEADEIRQAVAESVVEERVDHGEHINSVPEAIAEVAQVENTIETLQSEDAFTEVHQEKPKTGFFARLKEKLGKTRDGITSGLADLFVGKKHIDDDILEELETRLLMADVGVDVTQRLIKNITEEVSRKNLSNVDELLALLNKEMVEILQPVEQPLVIDNTEHQPYVILMVGVNGVGKTTTIGKLAKKLQSEGKNVMLAAGDTFRAAAVEQLKVWGERNNVPVIAQKEGSDPASVIFDAMESAKARKVDVLIADTAGRLHTQAGLMQELAKIHRVMKRVDETAPHEVMLVVDASTGQNALNQATQFNEIVPLSGITFTKLDGTAKGGIIFAIADKLKVPVRFIGVGEAIEDLRPFEAASFVSAIVDHANEQK